MDVQESSLKSMSVLYTDRQNSWTFYLIIFFISGSSALLLCERFLSVCDVFLCVSTQLKTHLRLSTLCKAHIRQIYSLTVHEVIAVVG